MRDGSVGIASYGGGEFSDDSKDVYLLLKRFDHDGAAAPSKLHSRDVHMRVLAFQTVQFLKQQLVAKISTIKDVRPSDLQLIYRGTELKGKRSLDEYDISGTADKPCVVGYYVRQVCQNGVGVDPDDLVPMAVSMREKLAEVQQSLLSGIVPRLTDDGTGGTYKIYSRTKRNVIAMFKPRDKEEVRGGRAGMAREGMPEVRVLSVGSLESLPRRRVWDLRQRPQTGGRGADAEQSISRLSVRVGCRTMLAGRVLVDTHADMQVGLFTRVL